MMELHDYRFGMNMIGGFRNDVWALCGRVYGRKGFKNGDHIYVSTPTSLDEENEILTTYSGSQYKLVNPSGDKTKIFTEIKTAIEKGYSRH